MVGFLGGALFLGLAELVFKDEVDLAAEKGLDVVFFGLFEEIGEAVEDAVVGNGEGLHAEFGGSLAEAVGAGASVQQAMVRVDVQMNEFSVFLWHS